MADAASDGSPQPQLPIRMLHDRVLLQDQDGPGERQTGGGLLIPATASLGKRLAWGTVTAVGQHVRQVQVQDVALYDPAEVAEVELDGARYVLCRERDLHAVRAPAPGADTGGLYL